MKKEYMMLFLGHLSHQHRRLCATYMLGCGITRGMPFMLDYLADHPGCIQRELSEHWHLDPASVTSVLASMEDCGLIKRVSAPGDRRKLQVFLTELGEQRAKVVDGCHRLMEDACFAGFSLEELKAFRGYLERIDENMKCVRSVSDLCAKGEEADDT